MKIISFDHTTWGVVGVVGAAICPIEHSSKRRKIIRMALLADLKIEYAVGTHNYKSVKEVLMLHSAFSVYEKSI